MILESRNFDVNFLAFHKTSHDFPVYNDVVLLLTEKLRMLFCTSWTSIHFLVCCHYDSCIPILAVVFGLSAGPSTFLTHLPTWFTCNRETSSRHLTTGLGWMQSLYFFQSSPLSVLVFHFYFVFLAPWPDAWCALLSGSSFLLAEFSKSRWRVTCSNPTVSPISFGGISQYYFWCTCSAWGFFINVGSTSRTQHVTTLVEGWKLASSILT